MSLKNWFASKRKSSTGEWADTTASRSMKRVRMGIHSTYNCCSTGEKWAVKLMIVKTRASETDDDNWLVLRAVRYGQYYTREIFDDINTSLDELETYCKAVNKLIQH